MQHTLTRVTAQGHFVTGIVQTMASFVEDWEVRFREWMEELVKAGWGLINMKQLDMAPSQIVTYLKPNVMASLVSA